MPRKQKMDFYQSLGFLYEQNYIASQLTDEPTGRLDPQAYLAGKNRCWRATGSFKQLHQKNIILSSWYIKHLDSEALGALISLLSESDRTRGAGGLTVVSSLKGCHY